VAKKEEIDLKTLRYVLYARKSTVDESKQIYTTTDQRNDCRKLAKKLGLNIVEEIEEDRSAKVRGNRPKFDTLIKNIGVKYDAIICWHPDRLCRNMYEGGMIIDMLDEGKLKDIRFHSHEFTNDANGKMMLGMLFVFSKNYSHTLSFKISESTNKRFDEGKSSGSPKWGYDRDLETGFYSPNEFFDVIKQAWGLRANGESYERCVKFLISKNYHRKTKPVGGKLVG